MLRRNNVWSTGESFAAQELVLLKDDSSPTAAAEENAILASDATTIEVDCAADTTRKACVIRKVNYSSSSSTPYHDYDDDDDDDDDDNDDDDDDNHDNHDNNDDEEHGYPGYESSDDDDYGYLPHPVLMRSPRRSWILDLLSFETREQLKYFSSDVADKRFVRACLGRDRYGFVRDTNPVEGLRISDSKGKLYIYWKTAGPSRDFLTPRETADIFERAVGHVRNQRKHDLCWAYLICDLISSYRVLRGLDTEFQPLCPMYLCANVNRAEYETAFEALRRKKHRCYPCNLQDALMFVKKHGIPQEREERFDCRQPRENVENEKYRKIKNVYKYSSLEEALTRLRTHPVGAGLICFEGWEEQEIYRGPLKHGGARYIGEHSVLMTECLEINGEMVVKCKSSTGEEDGFHGYILVSLEVMLILAGAQRRHRTQEGETTCHILPQYLLTDFYSVNMALNPAKALIEETRADREFNQQFEVKDSDEDGCMYAPRGELSFVKDKKKRRFGNIHKQIERTNEVVTEHSLSVDGEKNVYRQKGRSNLGIVDDSEGSCSLFDIPLTDFDSIEEKGTLESKEVTTIIAKEEENLKQSG